MDPSSAIHIRPATPADRPVLERMAAEVVAAGEMFVFERVDEVLAYWEAPAGRVYVAELDGTPAGTYVVKPNHSGRGAHVANAGYMTAEAFRGRGLGEAMGRHSLDTARELGYSAVQFNMVVATNASAVRLWERLGFRIVGTQPRAFRRPSGELADTHVMYREL